MYYCTIVLPTTYLSIAVEVTLWSISQVSMVLFSLVKTLLELPGSRVSSLTVRADLIRSDHTVAFMASRPRGKDSFRKMTASHQNTQIWRSCLSGCRKSGFTGKRSVSAVIMMSSPAT